MVVVSIGIRTPRIGIASSSVTFMFSVAMSLACVWCRVLVCGLLRRCPVVSEKNLCFSS